MPVSISCRKMSFLIAQYQFVLHHGALFIIGVNKLRAIGNNLYFLDGCGTV